MIRFRLLGLLFPLVSSLVGLVALLVVLGSMSGCESLKQEDSDEFRCDVDCTECKHVRMKCGVDVDTTQQEQSIDP